MSLTRFVTVPRALVAAVVAAAAVAALYPVLVWTGSTGAEGASVLQGPRRAPAVVLSPDGKRITCPEGAEPGVNLTAATFDPPLRGGMRFDRGTYELLFTGVVVNQTTRPIVVTGIEALAGHRSWRPHVEAPVSLAANSSGRLVLRGRYTSPAARSAAVSARLHWRWHDRQLAPCGAQGLIEDD
jgi:hypothetical protein